VSETENVLKNRGRKYGDFPPLAELSQNLYESILTHNEIFCSNENKIANDPVIREGISMIVHKLARVANGDCLYRDNFVDIAGYATLLVDYIDEENNLRLQMENQDAENRHY